MSPREIVAELDKYVVGQREAKKAVAIALRNRIRRQKLDEEMAEEIAPKNIIMLGPTGNLKAPTLRVGTTLLVGFSEEAYRQFLTS